MLRWKANGIEIQLHCKSSILLDLPVLSFAAAINKVASSVGGKKNRLFMPARSGGTPSSSFVIQSLLAGIKNIVAVPLYG